MDRCSLFGSDRVRLSDRRMTSLAGWRRLAQGAGMAVKSGSPTIQFSIAGILS